jgi:hypothetical protein
VASRDSQASADRGALCTTCESCSCWDLAALIDDGAENPTEDADHPDASELVTPHAMR